MRLSESRHLGSNPSLPALVGINFKKRIKIEYLQKLNVLRKMVSAMIDSDPQKTNLAVLKMYSEFATNPAIQLAFKLSPLVNLKIPKSRKVLYFMV